MSTKPRTLKEALDTEYDLECDCKYGHPYCALVDNGQCSDEYLTNLEAMNTEDDDEV